MIFIKFEENVQESSNDPLKNKNKDNDCPIQPVWARVAENIWLVSDSSAIEKVKDLHHYKSGENESEMSWMNFIFVVISDVIILTR